MGFLIKTIITVILIYPGCYRQFHEFISSFLDIDFEIQFFTQFLSENMDKLDFNKSFETTVAIHDSCLLARRIKDAEPQRKVLNAIPGLELVEMGYNREETLCCGGLTLHSYPEFAMELAKPLLTEAEKIVFDDMINTCTGCHTNLCRIVGQHGFGFKDIATLINDSLGGRQYEDKLENLLKLNYINKIIEASRTCFQ